MNIKPLISLVMCSALTLSFSMHCLADKTASSFSVERNVKSSKSSLPNKQAAEDMPNITNEAEYAAFVRRNEGAGQTSSAKSMRSKKSSSSSAASASHTKTPMK